MTLSASALDARVLVLNRLYGAIRVVDARRAFTLLCKNVAEVISVENGSYINYNLASWVDAAEFQHQYAQDRHARLPTPRTVHAVSKNNRRPGLPRRAGP